MDKILDTSSLWVYKIATKQPLIHLLSATSIKLYWNQSSVCKGKLKKLDMSAWFEEKPGKVAWTGSCIAQAISWGLDDIAWKGNCKTYQDGI